MPKPSRLKQINAWLEKWQPKLFLQQWHFTVDLAATDKEKLLAEVDCRPRYYEADITVFPRFWDPAFDESYRERTIVHEMAHAVVSEFSEAASARHAAEDTLAAANERLTETITSIAFHGEKGEPRRAKRPAPRNRQSGGNRRGAGRKNGRPRQEGR